jgi:3',5'-cyclic AMP phosphodiesterase CpdA
MDLLRTVRDRTLSIWQSAAEEVTAQRQGIPLAAARQDPKVQAASALAAAVDANAPLTEPLAFSPAVAVPGPVKEGWECARLAFQFAWATVHHNLDAVARVREQLQRFGRCDVRWITQTVAQFLHYFPHTHAGIPYRSGDDYVLQTDLPADATLAILGDWGTGTKAATDLLAQVKRKSPHVVLHLGDIYYSGTRPECEVFLQTVRGVLGDSLPVCTLSGNHDMYSGGAGYYWLLDRLNQPASYFCLRNADWQFLAMDTGYNDFNPFTVDLSVPGLTKVEAEWHLAKIRDAGPRQTVLLSHHPLFSAFEPIGGGKINTELFRQFKDVLGQVAVWFWGHEHRLDLYDNYVLQVNGEQATLERGRCVGCSAIPVPVAPNHFQKRFDDVPLLDSPARSGQPVRLGDNGTLYNHAYAIMQLNGPSATVSYYQHTDENQPLYVETIPASAGQ